MLIFKNMLKIYKMLIIIYKIYNTNKINSNKIQQNKYIQILWIRMNLYKLIMNYDDLNKLI